MEGTYKGRDGRGGEGRGKREREGPPVIMVSPDRGARIVSVYVVIIAGLGKRHLFNLKAVVTTTNRLRFDGRSSHRHLTAYH